MIGELPGGPRNVTEFNYRISDAARAHVFVGLTAHGKGESEKLVRNFSRHGFEALCRPARRVFQRGNDLFVVAQRLIGVCDERLDVGGHIRIVLQVSFVGFDGPGSVAHGGAGLAEPEGGNVGDIDRRNQLSSLFAAGGRLWLLKDGLQFQCRGVILSLGH